MISILVLTISSMSKAVMDNIGKNQWKDWWNKNDSSKYKYKNGDPKQGPKFFGSTTFLVWTTDGWHFFQMIYLNTLFLGLLMWGIKLNLFADFLIVTTYFKISFEIFYRTIDKLW